jgi:hypothetical protein
MGLNKSNMKANRKPLPQSLAKGQLWKTETAFILIVELGKTLIQYKMLKQEHQKAVRTQMTGIATLQEYLESNSARLVR